MGLGLKFVIGVDGKYFFAVLWAVYFLTCDVLARNPEAFN